MGPQNLPENIRQVHERIKRAAGACGRNVDSVTLLAVCKSQPPEIVRAAARAGLEHFGESYLQEALDKIACLADLPLTWHDGSLFGTLCAIHPTEQPETLKQEMPLIELLAGMLSTILQGEMGLEIGRAHV